MYRQHLIPGFIERIADGACIPVDPGNRDYADVLAWVAAGNTIAPLIRTFDRAAALVRLKAIRTDILDALTGVAGRLDRKGDTAGAAAADTAAQALLDLPAHPSLAACNSDAAWDATALYLYRQIAASCPPAVQAAFIGAM